jgi:hypothetical protein
MPKLQFTSPAAAVPWLKVYQVIDPLSLPPQLSLQLLPPVVLLPVVLLVVPPVVLLVVLPVVPLHAPF